MDIDESIPRPAEQSSRFVLSVLLHGALLSLLLSKSRPHVAPMLLPGDANGTQLTLTYLPGRARQSSKSREVKAEPSSGPQAETADPRLALPLRPTHAAADAKQSIALSLNSADSSSSANPDAARGADSLGSGNINIAYLDSFRSPRPDLSSLPRGASGDVILDVTIDTEGRIIALRKLSGVGYGIDESVIATVQAWVFHPATRDGFPVVSEQELHFHYEHVHNG